MSELPADPPHAPKIRVRHGDARAGGPCPGTSDETLAAPSGGPSADPTTSDTPGGGTGGLGVLRGSNFGRYRLLRQLGTGGMGTVWEAEDPEMGRSVAIKFLSLEGGCEGAIDERSLARFQREAQLAARLRHPNIVAVFDAGQLEGRPYIAMEHVRGRTLDEVLEETAPAKRAATAEGFARLRDEIALLAGTAEAVGYAHGLGVVHRDLKPGNVILDEAGRPRVMDFGIAKDLGTTSDMDGAAAPAPAKLTLTGAIFGTPAYMSPEQILVGADVGPWSDVWALGVMLYELLTGRVPHDCEDMHETMVRICRVDPLRPRAVHPGVPEDLEAVCMHALERDPRIRYRDAVEFALDLRRWLDGQPVRARRLTLGHRAERWARGHRTGLWAAGAVVAICAVALSVRGRSEESDRRALEETSRAIARLEEDLARLDVPAEAREALAAQPLGLIDRLVAARPRDGAAVALRGRVHALLGRTEAAEADFDRGCELAPERPSVWYLRAAHRIGRYVGSRPLPDAHYGSGAPRFDAPPAEEPAARALREGGLSDLAEMHRRGAPEDWLGDPEGRLLRALAASAKGLRTDFETAFTLLDGLSDALARRARGAVLHRLGRFAEATVELEGVVRGRPQDSLAWGLLGEASVLEGQRLATAGEDPRPCYRRGIEAFGEALRCEPAGAATRANRAVCLLFLGVARVDRGEDPFVEFDRARGDLDFLLEHQPGEASWRISRGNLCRHRADVENRVGRDGRGSARQAIDDYTVAAKSEAHAASACGNRATAWLELARALELHGEDPSDALNHALDDLAESLRLRPGETDAWGYRCHALTMVAEGLRRRGLDARPKYAEAVAAGDEAVRLAPDLVSPRSLRGTALVGLGEEEARAGLDARGRFVAAEADLEHAVRLNPASPSLWVTRGCVLRTAADAAEARGEDPRGLLRRAIASFDRAWEVSPGFIATQVNRGGALAALASACQTRGEDPSAEFTRAIDELRSAFAAAPTLPEAGFNLAAALRMRGEYRAATGGDPRADLRDSLAAFDAVLRAWPNLTIARNSRGHARFLLGQAERAAGGQGTALIEAAIADFDEALRSAPDEPRFLVNRGALLLDRATEGGKRSPADRALLESAQRDLDRVVALRPELPTPWGPGAAVRALLAELVAAEGGDPRPLLREAAKWLEEAVRLRAPDPGVPGNRRLIWGRLAGEEAARGGDAGPWFAGWLKDLEADLAAAPGDPERLGAVADASFRWGEWLAGKGGAAAPPLERAIEAYQRYLQAQPDSLAAHFNLGTALGILGQAEANSGLDPLVRLNAACAAFDAAQRLDPSLPEVPLRRGNARMALGDWTAKQGDDPGSVRRAAESDIREALRLGFAAARGNLGLLFRSEGRYDEAIAEFEEMGRACPEHATWVRERIEETRSLRKGK